MCLRHLKFSWYVVETSILAEMRPRLLEVKGHIGRHALLTDAKHPCVVADTSVTPGLATDSHLFTPRAEFPPEINGLQQRFADNGLVADGQVSKDRQAFIRTPLVLHRAADGDVFVSVERIPLPEV